MKTKRYTKLAMIGMALALALASCKPASEEGGVEVSPVIQDDAVVLAAGSFEGRNDHVVTGAVEILKSGDEYIVTLGADFALDGAPDPKVGLGKDGYDPKTKAGDLTSKEGASSYKLPAGVDPADFNEVYIWCEKFDVPLGVAKLTSK